MQFFTRNPLRNKQRALFTFAEPFKFGDVGGNDHEMKTNLFPLTVATLKQPCFVV